MRLLRRLSIRVRITAGSVLVGAVVLVASAVALHVQIDRASLETDRSLAMSDAAPFVGDLRSNPGEAPDRPTEGLLIGIRSSSGSWVLDRLPDGLRDALPRTVEHETTLRLTEHGHRTTVVGIPVRNDTARTSSGRRRTDGPRTRPWNASTGRSSSAPCSRSSRSRDGVAADDTGAPTGRPDAPDGGGHQRGLIGRAPARGSDGRRAGGSRPDAERLPRPTARQRRARAAHGVGRESRAPHTPRRAHRTPRARARPPATRPALERELSAAEADAARLVALANTMLELSRLDEQGPTPSTPAADLVSELMSSIDRARAIDSMGPRDVDFTVEVGVPEARHGVGPAAFARVVDNLVANAIAAGDVDGVVRVDLRQDTDRTLVLTVVDDGPGVPEAFLPQAFDRFTRADDSRTALGGSGLGLALVRGIAERAGGRRRSRTVTAEERSRPSGCRRSEGRARVRRGAPSLEVSNEAPCPFRVRSWFRCRCWCHPISCWRGPRR